MTFEVGSLVALRGREWVVLPGSSDEFLRVKPLTGRDEEVTGVVTSLEEVTSAHFDPPTADDVGDFQSARLLREAARLGFRGSAGPFRSFGRIAVEPRPYQLVPLLVALKQDPVRILIADDVGIGKTIEAGLVARELLDRGEVERLAVLCPPHLAEQWQDELVSKFNIEAELLLPSTIRRLEGQCIGESVFQKFPFLVISIDFIKSDRYRFDFIRDCPELVLVDEAHTCAISDEQSRGRHQRNQLIGELALDEDRHLILVTATPHSGKEEAFRSLISFLHRDFATLPNDLGGKANERHRRRLAQVFVQRRRADIRHFMKTDTPFPDREEGEHHYLLSKDYKKLFERVLTFARETTQSKDGDIRTQRIRWWSALSLLRSVASSPAAAAETLRNRAPGFDATAVEEVDELGERTVMDLLDGETEEVLDVAPGAEFGRNEDERKMVRRRLLSMAEEADKLRGKKDSKLQELLPKIRNLIDDGYHPIVFCRFIPTAEYVAEELRKALGDKVEVAAVTGTLAPKERESRILELAQDRIENNVSVVLVATDCLSEGVNLQEYFDAVIHYDLAWNPTRHEQREGRVDRYGQPKGTIRVLTYYGKDNQIDGIVLEVLLRKHRKIRDSLGVSVPMPVDSHQIMEAILEGLLLRNGEGGEQYSLPGFEPIRDELHRDWENVSEREKRSRTMFAQESIKVDDVAKELTAVQDAIGSSIDIQWFVTETIRAHGGTYTNGALSQFGIDEIPSNLKDLLPDGASFTARFELPIQDGELYLSRTHPVVENLASFVLDTALDPIENSIAKRCGVIRTNEVVRRTTLLLLRLRYSLKTKRNGTEHGSLAEECQLLAFSGSPDNPTWLDASTTESLLKVVPSQNVPVEQAKQQSERVLEKFQSIRPKLDQLAHTQAEILGGAHERVRIASRAKGKSLEIEPYLPVDVLGVYLFLPTPKTES
jgi:superfamily II DNA or RNA helicase